MPGGRFGCPDGGKPDPTTAAAASGGPVHRGYPTNDASQFLASAYGGPPSSSVGYRAPGVHHPPHYSDPQTGLMSYFSEAAAGLQSGFMGGESIGGKQGNAADYSTTSLSGDGKSGHPSSPSSFSLQQQQQQIHQLQMIQQQHQRLHQHQSQLQRQQLLSNLNLSGLHQGDTNQERATSSSSSNQYCKPTNVPVPRTVSPDVGRNLVNNFSDPSYHSRKKYNTYEEGNKNSTYNPQALLESNLMQRIGQSVMSCAMKDLAECASSSKTPEYSSPMKVENFTRNIPVSTNSPRDESKSCNLSGYREQELTPTREDSMCHDLPLETTLHEGDEYNSSLDGDKRNHHDKLMSPTQAEDILNQGGRAKIYECSLCTFTCRKQTDLVTHVTIHPDEKPFHCNQCDYKGAKYHYLRNHLLTHSQRPLLSCTECEYKCYQNGALKVHMRRHSDEKRYACTSCHYRTHFKGNLKLHLRVHTGEKPYACSVCDFRCTQSGSLKIHMRGHSGEKPYGCDICEYRSKHKGNLVMHRRKHTGDKPYHCDQCNYKAAQRMALTKHSKTVHGLDLPSRPAQKPSDGPSDLSVILNRKADENLLGSMANDSSNSPAPSEQDAPLHPKHEKADQPSQTHVSTPEQPYPYYEQGLKERKSLLHQYQEPWKLNSLKQAGKDAEDEQRYKGDEHDPLYISEDLHNKQYGGLQQNDADSSDR